MSDLRLAYRILPWASPVLPGSPPPGLPACTLNCSSVTKPQHLEPIPRLPHPSPLSPVSSGHSHLCSRPPASPRLSLTNSPLHTGYFCTCPLHLQPLSCPRCNPPHEPAPLSGTLEVRVVGCRDLPETIPWNPSPSVGGPGTPDSRTPFLSRPARGLYSRTGSLSGRSSLKAEAENTSEWH